MSINAANQASGTIHAAAVAAGTRFRKPARV
jgi:hypothetical protein